MIAVPILWGSGCRPMPVAAGPTLLSVQNHTEYAGKIYEILPDPALHRVVVITSSVEDPEPTLLLLVSHQNGPWKRIRLEVNRISSESVIYTGPLPDTIKLNSESRTSISPLRRARR